VISVSRGKSYRDVSNLVYMNLESIMCVALASLFFILAAARAVAGETCSSFYINVEIKATAVRGKGPFGGFTCTAAMCLFVTQNFSNTDLQLEKLIPVCQSSYIC
jgi:hypothetical protein